MGILAAPDKFRIVIMILIGVSVLINIIALAAPKWDSFITSPYGHIIHITQNLWSISDETDIIYKNKVLQGIPDESWKTPIIIFVGSGLGVGLLALTLAVAASTVTKAKNISIQYAMLSTIIALCSTSCGELIHAAMSFKENHLRVLSEEAFKPVNGVPLAEFGVDIGYYIAIVAGGWYGLSAAVALGDIIKIFILSFKKPVVAPLENGIKD